MGRKTTLWRCAASAWGPVVVTASEAGRRWPERRAELAARVGPACLLRAGGAGRLLCADGPSRPILPWVCFSSLSFSVLFSSPLFDFKFGLKFEFQIGVAYSLEF